MKKGRIFDSHGGERPSKIDEEISTLQRLGTQGYLSKEYETKDPHKLKNMRLKFVAAAERAETAASKGHRSNKSSPLYFNQTAAVNFKRAGDISVALKDYEGAADLYESSVRNYDTHHAKEGPIKSISSTYIIELGFEKEARKMAKKMRWRANLSELIRKISPFSYIFLFFLGVFFLSSNITGNVIGDMNNSTSNIIGGVLFVIGLIGAFFYFKNKKIKCNCKNI
ncbi:MAG: hypothetical protein WC438_03130 [Candidatus Pacearchaeota archaeon]